MEREYQETKLSKRAREKLAEPVFASYGEIQRKILEYDSQERERYFKRNGEPFLWSLRELFFQRGGRPEDFLEYCVRLNLSDEEVNCALEYIYDVEFNEGSEIFASSIRRKPTNYGLAFARTSYIHACDVFGINPDENFPDWGNWKEADEKVRAQTREFMTIAATRRPTRGELTKMLEDPK